MSSSTSSTGVMPPKPVMPGANSRNLPRWKRLLYGTVAVFLGFILLEGLCGGFLVARDLARFRREIRGNFTKEKIEQDLLHYCDPDPDLGWVNRPGAEKKDQFGPGRNVTINSQGVRSLREYGPPAPGVFRLLCLGDSFTFGSRVDDAQTFPARLEGMNPAVEAVNMGQAGYSVGQCWLRFKGAGAAFEPDLVLLAVIMDDFPRLITGPDGVDGKAPKFRMSGNTIEVYDQPVPALRPVIQDRFQLRRSFAFLRERDPILRMMSGVIGPAKPSVTQLPEAEFRETLNVGMAVIQQLRKDLEPQAAPLAVMLMPTIRDMPGGPDAARYEETLRRLSETCAGSGIPILDLRAVFTSTFADEFEPFFDNTTRHYSALGYKRTAEVLNEWLGRVEPRWPRPPAPAEPRSLLPAG